MGAVNSGLWALEIYISARMGIPGGNVMPMPILISLSRALTNHTDCLEAGTSHVAVDSRSYDGGERRFDASCGI